MQGDRKSDTFSPQVWRGDNGARWGKEASSGKGRSVGTILLGCYHIATKEWFAGDSCHGSYRCSDFSCARLGIPHRA